MESLQDKFEYAKEQLDIGNFGRVEKAAAELRASEVVQFVQYGMLLEALVLSEQEKDEEAIPFYDALIEQYPELEYAYYYRFEALTRLQDFEMARKDGKKLVRLDSENIAYHNCLIIADEFLGHYPSVIASCDQILSLAPEAIDFIFTKAMAKTKLGLLQEALLDYQNFIEADIDADDSSMAYFDMARIYLQLADLNTAKKYFEKARIGDDFDPQIESALGFIHAKTVDQAAGLAMINRAIDVESSLCDPFYHRAKLLLDMGNRAQAKIDLELARERDFDRIFDEQIDALYQAMESS